MAMLTTSHLLTNGLHRLGVHVTRLVGQANPIDHEQRPLIEQGLLTALNYTTANPREEPERVVARKNTFEFLQSEQSRIAREDSSKDHVFVLHLQTRYPESGGAFDKAFIQKVQGLNVKVVATVHEFKHNLRGETPLQWNIHVLNRYCSVADRVIFLNEHDRNHAIKNAGEGSLIVPPKACSEGYGGHHARLPEPPTESPPYTGRDHCPGQRFE